MLVSISIIFFEFLILIFSLVISETSFLYKGWFSPLKFNLIFPWWILEILSLVSCDNLPDLLLLVVKEQFKPLFTTLYKSW